jgi:hypothetical protein
MSEKWKPRQGQKITMLYAWVVTEPDGGEGIAGANIPALGGMVPLVGADRERMASLRPHAELVRRSSGYPVRLVRFGTREVLEELP